MIKMEVDLLTTKNSETSSLEEKSTLHKSPLARAQKHLSKDSKTSSLLEEEEESLDSKDNLRSWMTTTPFP